MRWFWRAFLGAGAAADWWSAYRSERRETLSSEIRRTFRTDTRPGRVAFVAAWSALTAWLIPHICRRSA